VTDSIIGIRAVVRSGSIIERTVIMGANFWENVSAASSQVPLGIGRDCHVKNAIIDFNARIGDGCRLVNARHIQHADAENYSIRDGIIVIPKNAVLPPGTIV
jgi:glucose-1-phosphate adenylyltransferase